MENWSRQTARRSDLSALWGAACGPWPCGERERTISADAADGARARWARAAAEQRRGELRTREEGNNVTSADADRRPACRPMPRPTGFSSADFHRPFAPWAKCPKRRSAKLAELRKSSAPTI